MTNNKEAKQLQLPQAPRRPDWGWGRLPAELRIKIFDLMLLDRPSCSSYVSVCSEWQPIFEQATFAYLTVDQNRMAEFRRIMSLQQRQQAVKHLWFCIEIQDRDDSRVDCWKSMSHANVVIIEEAIRDLFNILKTWKTPHGNITLHPVAYAPQDRFKRLSGPPPIQGLPYIGIVDLSKDFLVSLPEVPAVGGLVLCIYAPYVWKTATIQGLVNRFPKLREVHQELDNSTE
ncbi:hypothetical protein QBC35DRAFT_166297 [Podospora australis]|uniref:F-box domain-containing protein n=1 Tax=Podospora australis TaxID=1536484 RepID=A0AAN6WX20_9PEZI|nr:hypothetical protein QBC35DRAFT_166297 [Podospora australis]